MRLERVAFKLASEDRFARLSALVRELASAKVHDEFHDDAYWERFLDDSARQSFWWPTPSEVRDWEQRWFSAPVNERSTDPSLQTPWLFDSLVDAARQSEVQNLSCSRQVGGGVIEFEPFAWPFGGTDWIHALVEAFGGRITEDTAA